MFELINKIWQLSNNFLRQRFLNILIWMIFSAIFEVITLISIIPFLSAILENNKPESQNIIFQFIFSFYPDERIPFVIIATLIFSSLLIISTFFKMNTLRINTNLARDYGSYISNRCYSNLFW